LDFGSQFTQLITRRIRELNIYSEIQPYTFGLDQIKADKNIAAIILSGGPNSIYEDGSPQVDEAIFELGVPILGVCYGLQLMGQKLGGKVEASHKREYGRAELQKINESPLFKNIDFQTNATVWMSHGDNLTTLPDGFQLLGSTENCKMAVIGNETQKLYGLQFHPEVAHTQNGTQLIANFLLEIAKISPDWTAKHFVDDEVSKIQKLVGNQKVLCGLSGGVDSSVTAVLIHKAIGDQLHCMFVDHGLLRANEREEVEQIFRENYQIPLTVIDAREIFLSRLAGVIDPEQKRKIIGNTFIEIFETEAKKLGEFAFLAQGTLYPDVVESVSFNGGPSHTIKSHHNVGGLPEKMNFKLVEPLRELFKDEVRNVGRQLGLPEKMVDRHPFPGPGLAIRIIGDITPEKLETLRKADKIFIDELKNNELKYPQIYQGKDTIPQINTVQIYNQNLQEYIQKIPSEVSGEYKDWLELFSAFISTDNDPILEIGSGLGRDANFLENIGLTVERTDATSAFISHQIDQGKKIQFLDILYSPITKKYNGILASGVFHHFNQPQFEFIVDKISNSLNFEGFLATAIKLKNYPSASEKLPGRYLKDRTKEEVIKLFEQKGFEIISDKENETKTGSWLLLLARKMKPKTLYHQAWQAFCVLTEVRSVGVMGDGRTYENMLALRAVTDSDGMTADWAFLPYEFLAKVSNRIINEVKGVNRVVYDISSKPPATIEWE
jgi:GMP synthase (glutamine-hydrolysing)